MKKYECTYLVSDEVRENDLNKITGAVNGFVTALGGKVVKEDIWGRRKLAYPINKNDFATYITLFYDLPADKALELDRDLRQTSSIIRHLVIVKEHGHADMTLTADEIAETAAIEEAVGGEKSFEAVEGMTEDSRDLMAKRDKDVDEETELKVDEEPTEVAETPEAPKTEKPKKVTKKTVEPAEGESEKPQPEADQPVAEKTVRKPRKKVEAPAETKEKKSEDEAARLTKLNEELEDILKDEL